MTELERILMAIAGFIAAGFGTWYFARINRAVSTQHDIKAVAYKAEGAIGVMTEWRKQDSEAIARLRERVAAAEAITAHHQAEDDKRFSALELRTRGL